MQIPESNQLSLTSCYLHRTEKCPKELCMLSITLTLSEKKKYVGEMTLIPLSGLRFLSKSLLNSHIKVWRAALIYVLTCAWF